MRENLSLVDAFKQEQDTPTERPRDSWPVMALVLVGGLTFAWIGFLLWAAFHLLIWAFG